VHIFRQSIITSHLFKNPILNTSVTSVAPTSQVRSPTSLISLILGNHILYNSYSPHCHKRWNKLKVSLCLINLATCLDVWGSRDISLLFFTPSLDGSELSDSRPGRFITGKEPQYPSDGKLCRLQSWYRYCAVENRTPVTKLLAHRYTDWDIPALSNVVMLVYIFHEKWSFDWKSKIMVQDICWYADDLISTFFL
jgi:hypothetical protein